MTRRDYYDALPRMIVKLFTFGLGSAALFLFLWYMGGYHLWGWILDGVLKVGAFGMDIQYEAGDFVYYVDLGNGLVSEPAFPINPLNLAIVEVITLLACWPHKSAKSAFKIAGWSLLFLLVYQMMGIVLQFLNIEMGPDLANRHQILWQWESSWVYPIINKLAAFDKFVVRYWAGFPVFGTAFFVDAFLAQKTPLSGKKRKHK